MLRKADETPEEAKPNPICNRFIGPTIVSFVGKTLGISGAIVTTFPYNDHLPFIATGVGLFCGMSSGIARYHLITKANISPGVTLYPEGTATTPVTLKDERNAAVIALASSSDAVLEGYKTSLKTGDINPTLSWVFVITSGYNQLVSGMQATGQKWFGEEGKNFRDTWIGYILDKATTLDTAWITKNIIDIKSLTTTLKPTVEIASQYVSMLDFGKIVGASSPASMIGVHALAIAGTHTQNYSPRGYEQKIMNFNLNTHSKEKNYSAWVFDTAGKVVDKITAVGAVPLDLLSIVIPPKYVLYGAHALGSAVCGMTIYTQAFSKMPLTIFQNPYFAGPLIAIGSMAYVYSELTSLRAAWDQTVTISKKNPLNDEKEEQKIKIGVLPLVQKKFGEENPNDSYITGVNKRFWNYKNYVQNNLSSYYSSIKNSAASAGSYFGFFKQKQYDKDVKEIELQSVANVSLQGDASLRMTIRSR